VSASMRILYVAYPMVTVSEDSCGGAEQMLCTLESEIARRGYRTIVAACEGSRVTGELLPTGAVPECPDRYEARNAQHVAMILRYIGSVQASGRRIDLIHDKSGSFWRHAAQVDAPVLATLHLPRSFYDSNAFDQLPRNVFFNCVSESQARQFGDIAQMLGVVRNGIRVEAFPLLLNARDPYLLWIGRICEEKGTHIAIEVARQAGMRLVIAGDVYPFSYHQAYFEREVRPHLQGRHPSVCYVGKPTFAEKTMLIARAQAVLLPSLVDETSSLVSMEAMACGTPVIAFRRGAIPEVVRDGVTGLIVDSVEQMAEAVGRSGEISLQACREHVAANFTSWRMAAEYERLYAEVLQLDSHASESLAA